MQAKFYKSLRFKVAAGLFTFLVTILALFSFFHYSDIRNVMMDDLALNATHMGEIIEGGLQHAMITNDFSAVQQIVDDVARQPGVADLLLLDKEGKVLIAASREDIGTVINESDPTCQSCHQYAAASRNESVIIPAENGRLFRNVNAIENGPACWECHSAEDELSGVLITDFSMENIDRQLATVRNSSILWSSVSVIFLLIVLDLLMNRLVLDKLYSFLEGIRQISRGHFGQRVQVQTSDEIGELAGVFNEMAAGLQEKDRLEQDIKEQRAKLEVQTGRLTTLNTVAATVSQSLDLSQIVNSALEKVLELLGWEAGWIVLRDDQKGGFELAASYGLGDDARAMHQRCIIENGICSDVITRGESQVVALPDETICPTGEILHQEHRDFRICIPLLARERLRGVMTLFANANGDASPPNQETMDMLGAIGRQIGIAAENASLYQELSKKEALRKQLLAKILTAQEEERKRIARELHDGTSQALTSLLVMLKLLEEADTLQEAQMHIEGLRAEVARTLEEVHGLALGLRPTILDDLGLIAALRRYLKGYQQRFRLLVDFQVLGLEGQRLPPEIESSLYHILQEALINVARHADAKSVSIVLQHRGSSVIAIVEDDGKGFDVSQVMGSQPQKQNLGLYGMQERASLVGGKVTIEATLGTGTTVYVEMPLEQGEQVYEYQQDSASVGR